MYNIVLFEPEIPPNTGNVMRLAVNVGFKLHLVEPLGFSLSDKYMARAGMDYSDLANVKIHVDFEALLKDLEDTNIYLLTTKGKTLYTNPKFQENDTFIFGPETRGLPDQILNKYSDTQKLRLPMTNSSRSLNLSNTVAIVAYEVWRQLDFKL